MTIKIPFNWPSVAGREYARTAVLSALRAAGIDAVFHHVPLHSSPAGRRFGRASGTLLVTEQTSDRLIRLPLWMGMAPAQIDAVVEAVGDAVKAAVR